MTKFNPNSDHDFEQMKSFLIGDDEYPSSNSNIPFDLEELKDIPYYKKPFVQLFVVFGTGISVIYLTLLAFKTDSPSIAQATPVQLDQEKQNLLLALQKEQEKTHELELQNALLNQQDLVVTIPNNSKSKPKPKPKPKSTPVVKTTATLPSQTVSISSKPKLTYKPTPPRRSHLQPVAKVQPQPVVNTAPQVDPMTQWLAIANQGHYTTSHVTQKPSTSLVSNETSSTTNQVSSADSNCQTETLAENSNDDDSVVAPLVKVKSPTNYGLLYVLAFILLLFLPSNRHAASSKTVQQDSQDNVAQNREQIELLESKLQELDSKTQILTAQVATYSIDSLVKIPSEEAGTETKASTEVDSVVAIENLNQLPEYELPSIPLPIPAPPPITTLSELSSINVTVPFPNVTNDSLLPVPALPVFGESLNLVTNGSEVSQLPPPPPESLTTNLVENPIPENNAVTSTPAAPVAQAPQQWLGQTDTVYFSGSFQQESTPKLQLETAYEMPDLSFLSSEDLNQYLIIKPSTTPEIDQELLDSELQDSAESNQLAVRVENAEFDTQSSELQVSLNESIISEINPDTSSNSVVSKPALFDDNDLSNYLDDTPLLDDKFIA